MTGTPWNSFLSKASVTRNLFVWMLGLAIPAVAPASVIFTNFGAGQAYDTGSGNPVGNAFDGNTYAEGGIFTPGANANFGSVSVALSCVFNCGAQENFTVALASDSGSRPGAVIEALNFTGTTLGALGTSHAPVTGTSTLKPLLLAGTRYWIVVSAFNTYAIAWNLNLTSDPAIEALSADGGSTWFSPSGNTPGAFEVDSALVITPSPEPDARQLLGAALLLAWLCKRYSAIRTRALNF